MIRSTLPRASKLARPADHSSGHSHPTKAFIRRLDKNNDVYYTLAKRGLGRNPDPNKEHDFFQVSDLLLDLDAEGARYVRPVDDDDDAALMKAKWAKVPRREEVRARLKEFEAQLAESRTKAHAILTQPTNIWRITPHDVVSAALHGGSAVQRTAVRSSWLLEPPTDLKGTRAPRGGQSDVVDKIRAENGIPPHAAYDDELLLHWMMLRYKSLQEHCCSSADEKAAPASPEAVMQALEAQCSVTGIRRLVFQYLAAGADVSMAQPGVKLDARLLQGIRDACERVLRQSTSDSRGLLIETLTFLGNLSEKLSSPGGQAEPLLCSLAMKLAGRIGSLEATSAWLFRCSRYDGFPESFPEKVQLLFLQDVLSTLDSLQSTLTGDDGSLDMRCDARQRQLLFQMLTGIDENNKLARDSIRSLVRLRLDKDGLDTAAAAAAAELQRRSYARYLTILGHLGAFRTIWKEWRYVPPFEAAHPTTALSEKEDGVARAFATALQLAVSVMPPFGDKLPTDASLEECVTADHGAIENQRLDAGISDNTGQHDLPDAASCRSALDLPLGESITRIGSWRAR